MFEHAVVGVDFSTAGEAMISTLHHLKQLGTNRLTLVHGVRQHYVPTDSPGAIRGHEERLAGLAAELAEQGFETEAEVVVDDPAAGLERIANDRNASLIVVGSRGHSRATTFFVGSVAWGVVRRARRPVLLRRLPGSENGEASPPAEFTRVIYPTDFSEPAARAFEYVSGLAEKQIIRRFQLLHIGDQVREVRTGEPASADSVPRLEELADRLRAAGATEVETGAPSGAPFREIVERADADPSNLIVMGTHGRGFVGDVFIGSVSHEVVRRSRGSVLLIGKGS